MTRVQYEKAKRAAVMAYMDKARADHEAEGATKRQKANANRRFNLCSDLLREWNLAGFWTAQNEMSYKTLYKDMPGNAQVSAI